MPDTKDTSAPRQLKTNFDSFLVSDVNKYEVFKERVELFFQCNPVAEECKSAIFLNGINEDVYKLLKDRVHPVKPVQRSLKDLFEVLDEHYKVVVNVRSERFKFNGVRQEAGEKLSDFVVRLREAAVKCGFGEFIELKDVDHMTKLRRLAHEEALLDRFVMGLDNKQIQEKLLMENPKTFEVAFNLAKTMQMALDEKRSDSNDINLLNQRSRNRYQQRERSSHRPRSPSSINSSDESHRSSSRERACVRCGYQQHHNGRCPAYNKTCAQCNQRGHFARCCKGKKVDIIIGNISKSNETFYVPLSINGIRTKALIDTGACVNLISPSLADQLGNVILKDDSNILRTFSGSKLNVVGRVIASVVCVGTSKLLEFQVVDTGRTFTPLLGRPGLDELFPGWRNAFGVAQINEIKSCFEVELKNRFPNVFDGDMSQSISGFKAEIILKEGHIPIFAKAYSVPLKFEDQVKEELKKLVSEGVLEPCVTSRYASPIVIVPKSDKSAIRICIDCKRTINKYVVNSNFYPLPNMDLIFASMFEATRFNIIDLKQAYQQIELSENSREILTINTVSGLYRYTRLPFGISAAPSIFQMVIDKIIEGIPMTRAYLDDLIIGGRTEDECRANTIEVMKRLSAHNVKVNAEKCIYLKSEVKYLGHILGHGKLLVNPIKVEAIKNAPAPKDVKELQAFMGLINYYRKFVPDISMKLASLYELLGKGKEFVWSKECERTFEQSKLFISSEACLQLYNPKAETLILCDASPIGVAAVLVQKNEKNEERPVYYASKILNDTQKRYAQLHREGLAVVFGLKKFYKYIYGRPVTIVTDALSIKEMFSPDKATHAVASARIQRWSVYLSQFEYQIEHRASRFMCVPDALSRLPVQEQDEEDLGDDCFNVSAVLEELPVTFEDILRAGSNDPGWLECRKAVQNGFPGKCVGELERLKKLKLSLSVEDNAVFYNDRVLVPLALRKELLYFCHRNHQGMVLMKKLARKYMYWPGIDKDIEDWVDGCRSCQRVSSRPKKKVTSHWIESTHPFERVHLDFFHLSGKTALVIVDSFSKLIEVVPMKRTTSGDIIKVLCKFFELWGLPGTLVSDNGPPFNSYEFVKFCKDRAITCLKSPAYHPQSNGLAEVAVRVAKSGLKKLCFDNIKRTFEENVQVFLAHHRHTPRSAGQHTPMELVLAYRPKLLIDLVKNPKRVSFKTPVVDSGEPVVTKTKILQDKEQHKYEKFQVNDRAYYYSHFKDYSTWIPCRVIKQESRYIYKIKLADHTRSVHVSSLRIRRDNVHISQSPVIERKDIELGSKRKRSRSEETSDRELPRRSERIKKFRVHEV